FGVMGTLEARKDRWLIIVDGFYIRLSRSSDPILGGDLGTARLSVDNGIVQAAGGYRVLQNETTPVDVVAGIRYTNLNTELSLSSSPLLPAGAQHSDRVDWVDGFIGVRGTYKFADRWTIWGYADVGAGGSNFSWQLIAALLWDATKSVSL